MRQYLFIFLLSLLFNFPSQADHQYEEYSFHAFHKYEIKGSDNYYQFNSDLIQDEDVKKEIDNNRRTRYSIKNSKLGQFTSITFSGQKFSVLCNWLCNL